MRRVITETREGQSQTWPKTVRTGPLGDFSVLGSNATDPHRDQERDYKDELNGVDT